MLSDSTFHGVRLCVVGNVNRDVKIAPIAAGEYLFSDGETSTDAVRETIGGGGANSALAAAMLGADVAFAGKVGDDAWGRRLDEALQRKRVRTFLARDPRHPTGTSINLVFANGHRHFVSHLPSSRAFTFQDLDFKALDQAQHLLRADIWFSQEMLCGGNARLFAAARERGVATSIDLNWDPEWGHASEEIVDKRKDAVRSVLPLVDLVHGNIRELSMFTGADDLQTALKRIIEWGARAVVVHQGKDGSGYYTAKDYFQQPSLSVAAPVNTTGTGDVLSVCMILLHHRADDARDKLRFANQIVSEYMRGVRALIPAIE